MASGRKRGAGERVLESKHVIGLFLLMLVFSGIFFSLGYVMGRNQFGGQVRAETLNARAAETSAAPPATALKSEPLSRKPDPEGPIADNGSAVDPALSDRSGWEIYSTNTPAKHDPRLDAPAKPAAEPAAPKTIATAAKPAPVAQPLKSSRTTTTTVATAPPATGILLQVAAVSKQDDALTIASTLQKKHFPATVLTPQKDKFYRVQVGPYKDQKAADTAKKGLESAGFKAFYVKH